MLDFTRKAFWAEKLSFAAGHFNAHLAHRAFCGKLAGFCIVKLEIDFYHVFVFGLPIIESGR